MTSFPIWDTKSTTVYIRAVGNDSVYKTINFVKMSFMLFTLVYICVYTYIHVHVFTQVKDDCKLTSLVQALVVPITSSILDMTQ